MANDLNQVFLIGRLARDPEFKTISTHSLVNFPIACGRAYTSNNGEKREESHFFDCQAWGKLADIIQKYTAKGKQIAIQGRLKQDTWETPDGKKASRVRIVVESMQLLGNKMSVEETTTSNASENNTSSNYVQPTSTDNEEVDEEVPF